MAQIRENLHRLSIFVLCTSILLSLTSSLAQTPVGSNVCGDGILGEDEQCEGGNRRDETCVNLGFKGGKVGCTAECKIDTSLCYSTALFSDVSYFGDRRNYKELFPHHWSIKMHKGRLSYGINTSDLYGGLFISEYALIKDRSYTNFRITLDASSPEDLSKNLYGDYVIIFGMENPSNYYYFVASSYRSESQLYLLKNAKRTSLARAHGRLIPDNDWHSLELVRIGETIEVKLDGTSVFEHRDSTFPSGLIGIGSYNDSVYFDDISIKELSLGK